MRITKKCSVCDYKFTYDDKVYINPLVEPHDEGAKYYYNLWHFFIEKCPNCGYASRDLSEVLNKDIVKDDRYLAVAEIPIIVTLERARPNRIADYLYASIYYESIGDTLNYSKCMLQASDLIYNEMFYWDEYVLDDVDSMSAIQNKAQFNEFKKFADGLFNKGVEALEEYVARHPYEIDTTILLAGVLNTGNKMQKIKGARLINRLKSETLTDEQKLCVKFLIDRIN
ncbi:MAG: hypothetical protein ACI4PF_02265 [Christensenellales bacterium]